MNCDFITTQLAASLYHQKCRACGFEMHTVTERLTRRCQNPSDAASQASAPPLEGEPAAARRWGLGDILSLVLDPLAAILKAPCRWLSTCQCNRAKQR